ncbi:hypothetical protein JCM33374_g6646 [Metschnikowia sp. JCM 33374]|nr:hypothetical protein JCM33374_g6646 [Metschnikowia sp. JCM 33374]
MSITHYIGVSWNESMIDEEITGLLHLGILDIREHFEKLVQPLDQTPATKPKGEDPEENKQDLENQMSLSLMPSSRKPLYSIC